MKRRSWRFGLWCGVENTNPESVSWNHIIFACIVCSRTALTLTPVKLSVLGSLTLHVILTAVFSFSGLGFSDLEDGCVTEATKVAHQILLFLFSYKLKLWTM